MNGTPTVKIVERAALPQLSNWNFDCDSKSARAGLSLKSRHYFLIGGRTQPIRDDCRVFTLLSGDCIVYIFAYRNNGALSDKLSGKVLTVKEVKGAEKAASTKAVENSHAKQGKKSWTVDAAYLWSLCPKRQKGSPKNKCWHSCDDKETSSGLWTEVKSLKIGLQMVSF